LNPVKTQKDYEEYPSFVRISLRECKKTRNGIFLKRRLCGVDATGNIRCRDAGRLKRRIFFCTIRGLTQYGFRGVFTRMFRKKRLVLYAVLAAALVVGWRYDWRLAGCGLALLALLLGALSLYKRLMAHRGFESLARHGENLNCKALEKRLRAQTDETAPFTFVVLGDTRNRKKITAQVYRRAAAEKPALIFHTGDIIRHGTAPEYLENHIPLLEITDPAPMFCVPGNHERGARRDFAGFKALYGGERFAFEFGPCCFIGFNNSGKPRIREEDLAFVREKLESTEARWKFLFYHIPPAFFEDRIVSDARRRGFRKHAEALHELCVCHDVTEIFMAHIHGYASQVIDGVRYTLTAGGGAPLSRRLAEQGQAWNYVVVHVRPDGLEREAVRCVNGEWVRE
jgi:hypothetical protein